MHVDRVDVGNVTFINSPENIIEPTARKAMDKILGTQSEAENAWHYHMKERFDKHTIAIVAVDENDKAKAEAIAEKVIEQALNVLRFYLSGLSENNPFFYKMFVGIEGTTYTGLTTLLVVDEQQKKVTYQSSRRGTLYGYELDQSTLDKMKDLHFEYVGEILHKPEKQRRPLENNLITAIDFFGAAMNAVEPRNSFINFIISLESALLTRHERKKAQNISKWIILLFLTPSIKRRRLFEKVSGYYKIRSDIIHEGIDNVDEDSLYGLFYFTFQILIQLVPYTGLVDDKSKLRRKLYTELKAAGRI